jgi:metal-dependent hydrolase (beta-lactamase superfamily II)
MGLTEGEMRTPLRTLTIIVTCLCCAARAHPGVTGIAEEAKRLPKGRVAVVPSGSHLGGKSQRAVAEMVKRFRELGARWMKPRHCSWKAARAAFERTDGKDFLAIGVGFIPGVQDLGAVPGDGH